MKCKHQFFKTVEVVRDMLTTPGKNGIQFSVGFQHDGYEAVCVLCGERREVTRKGKISVYDKKSEQWNDLI